MDTSKLHPGQIGQIEALQLATETPEMVTGWKRFKQAKANGKMEIHFASGGVAKVFISIEERLK